MHPHGGVLTSLLRYLIVIQINLTFLEQLTVISVLQANNTTYTLQFPSLVWEILQMQLAERVVQQEMTRRGHLRKCILLICTYNLFRIPCEIKSFKTWMRMWTQLNSKLNEQEEWMRGSIRSNLLFFPISYA